MVNMTSNTASTPALTPPSTAAELLLEPGRVSLAQWRRIAAGGLTLRLHESARAGLLAAQRCVQRIVDEDQVVYGINTGFGKLASTRIAHERLAELQRNLVLSHSVGTGEPLPAPVVRMVLASKAVSLARGHSGVRPELVEALLALANADLLPVIPAKGSVGASGDLAPLAHLACVLIGEGEVLLPEGGRLGGAQALARIGLQPFVLGPKEGLALLNGTQVSTALRWPACLAPRRCLPPAWRRAPCRWRPSRARSSRWMRASTLPVASPGRSRWPRPCVSCWRAATSCIRMSTAAACKTRIRSAACPR